MNWVRAASLRQRGDGNVLLHETFKRDNFENIELTTWVFEGFVPTAKLVNGKAYSIISDHLGTPILAVDSEGNEVWNRQLDIYGRVKREIKASSLGDDVRPFIPFLYQGQYYDFETKLAYNRFRYYSPESSTYISQDPIRLVGNNPNFYGYTFDSNTEVDVWGLTIEKRSIDIIIKTGTEANATMPNYDPPYKPNSKVTEFTTTQEEFFVRVHGENNKGGQWMMHESAIRGLSPEEIKEKFSLPEVPTHKTTVVVPKGTRIRSGKINPLLSFGGIDKNAKQFQLLERIPDECFKNTKPLKKEH